MGRSRTGPVNIGFSPLSWVLHKPADLAQNRHERRREVPCRTTGGDGRLVVMPPRWIPIAAAVAASLAVEAPALAAISSPPAFPREVTIFPERDFVVVDLWPANQPFRVEVLRNGVVIGTATGTTDADGLAEINHPGGFCWTGFTPDILPGDSVRALELDGTGALQLDGAGQPIGDMTLSSLITAQPATQVGSQVVIHGTARTPAGGQMPLGSMEQRIVNPALVGLVGKRDIRAPGNGTLAYDAPGSTNWTATYSGLSGAAMSAAVGGETRILSWMAAPAGNRSGLTIFEANTLGGPGFGGCPLGAANAVTAPGVLNATSLAAGAADVVFSGASQPDATGVDVSITDGTTTITKAATMAAGSWTAAVPVSELNTLADGALTASGAYAVAGGAVTGSTLGVVKDTVVPDAPTASLAPGTYEGTQSIVLHSTDPSAAIHYTTNGTEPTKDSPKATGQVSISNSQTLKAVAIDPAANTSPVSSLAYTITPKAAERIVTPGSRIVVVEKASRAVLSLNQLSLRKTVTRKGLRRSGLRLGTQLARGTEVLRVRVYKGTRLITTSYQFPGRSGRYSVQLKSKKVRALKPGKYVVEVTPGTSRQNLGNAARAAFLVR
jgi:hypothetical protein